MLLSTLLFCSSWIMAQEKLTKVSQSIKVNKDVKIDLNTSQCNIIFDTWNRDVVEVEAYVEADDLSPDELQEALEAWELDIDASLDKVAVKTDGSGYKTWVYSIGHHRDEDVVKAVLKELQYELAKLPDVELDVVVEPHEFPELPELPEIPELPRLPKLPEGVKAIKFDYEAYKKDGDKYLEFYAKEFEEKYGEDFVREMEAWGESFSKEWKDKYTDKIEKWAEKYEQEFNTEEFVERMETLGERHATIIEQEVERHVAHAERTAARAQERAMRTKERAVRQHERIRLLEDRQEEIQDLMLKKPSNKVKKTIKIKMPKKAKLKVDVRHGEIEFASAILNLKADLAYTKFKANSIDGSQTSINASYSPVQVSNWNLGKLNLNYVEQAELNNVKHIVLNSISSNIDVTNLLESAIIDANIGDLRIDNIGDDFTSMNIILQNGDALITLPKVDCSFQFKGTRCRFSHPEKLSKENTSNFSSGSLASGKSIVISAKYSNVVTQ